MTDLGTLGGSNSLAYGVNLAGQVVGYSETAAGEQHAFLWTKGVMTDLGLLGGSYGIAWGITPAGAWWASATCTPSSGIRAR